MTRTKFYICQNENGEIYAYTDDFHTLNTYLDEAITAGFKYTVTNNGIADIYTLSKS